jgi:hypothetical protein
MLPNGMSGVEFHHELRVLYKDLPEHHDTCTNSLAKAVGVMNSLAITALAITALSLSLSLSYPSYY